MPLLCAVLCCPSPQTDSGGVLSEAGRQQLRSWPGGGTGAAGPGGRRDPGGGTRAALSEFLSAGLDPPVDWSEQVQIESGTSELRAGKG